MNARICTIGICYWLLAVAVIAKPPNIVCFVADDLGVADLGCYGHPFVETPHIDGLAKDGMRFTQAFAGSPTCAPSRSILFTGLMSSRTGAHPNHWGVNPKTKSIGHYLGELGYKVAVFNKIHVKPEASFPFERIKAATPQKGGGGRTLDPKAIGNWLDSQSKAHPNQPLCLFLCDNNTHLPWPDKEHGKMANTHVPPYLPKSDETVASMARYFTEVELLDQRVGECIAELKKRDLFEQSVFLFTSDQGPAWLHGKWSLYDLGIQVPLIVRWPKNVQRGAVSKAMVSLVDITPTFMEIAGGNPVGTLDGKSFLNCVNDSKKTHRSEVFSTHTGDGKMNNYPCRSIRTDRFKLIWNLRHDLRYTTHLTLAEGVDRKSLWNAWEKQRGTDPQIAQAMDAYERRPEFELFDLNADPNEMANLATNVKFKETFSGLKSRLEAWMDTQGDQRRDMSWFLNEK